MLFELISCFCKVKAEANDFSITSFERKKKQKNRELSSFSFVFFLFKKGITLSIILVKLRILTYLIKTITKLEYMR